MSPLRVLCASACVDRARMQRQQPQSSTCRKGRHSTHSCWLTCVVFRLCLACGVVLSCVGVSEHVFVFFLRGCERHCRLSGFDSPSMFYILCGTHDFIAASVVCVFVYLREGAFAYLAIPNLFCFWPPITVGYGVCTTGPRL